MAEDFGSDLKGVADLTPTLDEVSGGECVAERVARGWLTVRGGLWYDLTWGEAIQQLINAPVYPAKVSPRLRALAERDECVQSASISMSLNETTKELEILAKLVLNDSSDTELEFTLTTDGTTSQVLLSGG